MRSRLFFKAHDALLQLQQTSPGLRFLFENVAFDEQRGATGDRRSKELRRILELLRPDSFLKFDAALISPAKRRRMYITNLPGVTVPEARNDRDWKTALDDDHLPPMSAQTDDGIRYAAFNVANTRARKAPTLTVRQDTWSYRDKSALVINTLTGEPERPRIHELERMVGLLEGATAAEGVEEEDRRRACGDVIDRFVLTHLFKGLALPAPLREATDSIQAGQVNEVPPAASNPIRSEAISSTPV